MQNAKALSDEPEGTEEEDLNSSHDLCDPREIELWDSLGVTNPYGSELHHPSK